MPNTLKIHYLQHTRRYEAEKSHYLKKCVRQSFLGWGKGIPTDCAKTCEFTRFFSHVVSFNGLYTAM